MAVSRRDRMIHHAGTTVVNAICSFHAEGAASCACSIQPFWLGTLRRSGLDRASRNTKPPGLHHCWDVSQPTSLPRPQCLKNMNRSQAIGYASRVLWSLRVSRLAGSPCVGQVSTELHATQNRWVYVTAGTCASLRHLSRFVIMEWLGYPLIGEESHA
jgi:hypothetical protein